MNDATFTHRPGPAPHQGALEALVYVRQTCTIHPLPAHGKLRLGRGTDNDIRIDDQSVSRYHLLIHVGDSIEVEDLGSANGTLLFRVDPEDTLEAPTDATRQRRACAAASGASSSRVTSCAPVPR